MKKEEKKSEGEYAEIITDIVPSKPATMQITDFCLSFMFSVPQKAGSCLSGAKGTQNKACS